MSNTSLKGNTKKLPYAATPWLSVSIQLLIQQKYQQIFSQSSLKWEQTDILPPITVKYSSFKKDIGGQVIYVYLTPAVQAIRNITFTNSYELFLSSTKNYEFRTNFVYKVQIRIRVRIRENINKNVRRRNFRNSCTNFE